jgi:small GTP-binding protein
MSYNKIKVSAIKIGLLGDSTVGKTAICNSFMGIEFTADNLSTIGQEKLETKFILDNGKEIKLSIWDTAGQERFRATSFKTLRAAHGVIVVFDVTKRETFEHVDDWLKTIKEELQEPNLIIFGNKVDMEDRKVTAEEAENYAKKQNLKYFETSAKLSLGIKDGFKYLVNDTYKKVEGKENKNIKIGENEDEYEYVSGCFGKKKRVKKKTSKGK